MNIDLVNTLTKVGIVVVCIGVSAAAYFINGQIPDLFANLSIAAVSYFVGSQVERQISAR